ncbi:FAD:protein FMN transferase [Defluviimonas aestuarii]|uniref:FAD:protein FMN transferase n=1 Tax=Albidovulum aestuarii TaxID=1130726 RepID=UPI00249BA268|nr:FAD:protein FMN transferase [Defluviimonas aestuarii]MDI3338079.1 FAD:protein FMN transferase [Defluviimonas aestuarii]
MDLTRRLFLISALAGAVLPARAAQAATKIAGPAFGSSWHAVLPGGIDAITARRTLMEEIAAVDAAMSPYRTDSGLTRFNRSRDTGWQQVEPMLAHTLSVALDITRLSGGAFDPTIGPLVRRYGFGPIVGPGAGNPAGLHTSPDAIRKAVPDLTIDLCGIAKGYALDRMVAALTTLGHTDFLIELGGEIACRGHHPEGRDWLVAVEAPGGGAAQRVLKLGSKALATSGHAANGFPRLGLSHVIDPGTARPAAPNLASASVLAETAERADALATALLVLGSEAGPDLARARGIDALFLTGTGPAVQEAMTGTFARHIVR